jgi:membrane protein YdbS with pleckstrin-like domain
MPPHPRSVAATAPPSPRDQPKLLKAAYLGDTEGLLRETRATGLFYFPGPILWLIVFGALDYWALAAPRNWPLIGGSTGFFGALWTNDVAPHANLGAYLTLLLAFITLLLLIWLLVRYLRWIRTVFAVTTTRVIVQRGILGKDFDEIPIAQVRGVDVHQTIAERMLGYGTVRVSSEGGITKVGNEDWRGIPKPFEFQRLIESATQVLARNR